jgi:hypothetical protein
MSNWFWIVKPKIYKHNGWWNWFNVTAAILTNLFIYWLLALVVSKGISRGMGW